MRGIEQYLQVDAATLGALKYAGTWNASTNTPTLASGVGTQGQYYVVSVAGSTNLDGETNWQVGDWAVFNGSVWQKVDGGSTGLLSTLTVTGNTYLATTSGNVGIGTTSPVSQFNMYNATNATATIQGDAIVTLAIERYSTNSIAPSFAMRKFRGTLAAPTAVATGDVIANLNFVAYGGTTQRVVSQVRSFVDTYVSDTDISSYLTFSTSPAGSAAATEQMRITSAGNVGIGTSSPGYRLDVYKAGAASISAARSDTQAVLRSEVGACAADLNVISTYGEVRTATNHPLLFSTNATERMRIDTSGNVGIGTSSPVANLDVRGASGGILGQFLENSSGSNRRIRFSISSNVSNIESIASTGSTNLAFAVDGTERMRIDASGNVGIGAIPTGYGKLEVYQSANNRILFSGASAYGNNAIAGINDVGAEVSMGIAGSPVVFYTNATERMRITSTGTVGIGTSSPAGTLHVYGSGTTQAVLTSGDQTTTYLRFINTTNGGGYVGYTNDNLTFLTGSSERMRLDSSGNLGLGVTPSANGSIYYKAFEIGKAGCGLFAATAPLTSSELIYFAGNAVLTYSAGPLWSYGNNGNAATYGIEDGNHKWYTAPSGTAGTAISFTQAMTLDASGNLGIGVTPSAWGNAGYSAINAKGDASFVGLNAGGTNTQTIVGNNWYDAGLGSPTYIASNFATRYSQFGGQHLWFNAPSGTAGNAISFTQAMTLDANGNLLVGTTSNPGVLNTSVVVNSGASSLAGLVLQNNATGSTSTDGSHITIVGTELRIVNLENAATLFSNNGSERMRITAAGNVGIGTTNPIVKLDIEGSGQTLARIKGGSGANQSSAFYVEKAGSAGTLFAIGDSAAITGGTPDASVSLYTSTSVPLIMSISGSERMRITSAGNIHTPAGATTMTNGFFYIPAAAGVPTGVPTAITGTVPMYYDTTNNKFYVYNGAWKSVTLT